MQTALQPNYNGAINLHESFPAAELDFILLLSPLSAVIGTLGQSNYAAGGMYQDMFSHSQASRGNRKFVTLDSPLVKDTYPVTQDRY